jgi:uncharacterized protein YjbI with pentapeptide repeats
MHNGEVESESLFEVVDKFLMAYSPHRHLLLLADSGMGKSSFVLNYYVRNCHRPKRKRHQLVVVPLNAPKADEHIADIENPQDAMLFLDAFDEDQQAIANHRERLAALMEVCHPFKRVLITCRTQFFPTDEVLPRDTGIIRVGAVRLGEKKVYEFFRQYLAPFDDSQVEKFLRKRYSILQWRQRNKARELVRKIPLLSVRPMLLSHIPDLIDSDVQIEYAFQLYEILVEKWLEREEYWVNKDRLRNFSERLAVDFYTKRQGRGTEGIPHAELTSLAKEWSLPDLKDWQLRGRSLLNRDAMGNYKFAHRSILEYLIVRRLTAGDDACLDLELTDQMALFLREMVQHNGSIVRQFELTDHIQQVLVVVAQNNASKINSQNKNYQGFYLIGANLQKADLQGADLSAAQLQSAHLQEAQLRSAHLRSAHLRGAQLQGADLSESSITEADLQGANLQGADLSAAQLQSADLQEADLQEANLQGADLQEANLQGANLQNADLQGAHLQSADLQSTALQGADFQNADLQGAHLQGANLQGTDLQNADLQGAHLQSAQLQGAQLQKSNLRGEAYPNVKTKKSEN